MGALTQLATASSFISLACSVASLSTISVIGAKFYDSNFNQFFIKGVVYQLAINFPLDPLIDTAQCTRDAALMKELGANTIRVYTVDATANHDGCMSAFEDAGIYVMVGLNSPLASLNRVSPQWTNALYNNYTAVIDAFAGFDNTLGFFAGNEDVNSLDTVSVAPYVKAIAVDMKAYRDGMGYRNIPIGYGAADLASLRPMLQNYMACGDEGMDFFGMHIYSWCGDDSMASSGYDKLYANASDYNIPIFIAETGCLDVQPRVFNDQNAVLGTAMNDRFSGAIIYEWAMQANGYGLVTYSASASGVPTTVSGDFSNLKSRWSTLTPTGTPIPSYDIRSLTTPACPTSTSNGWTLNGDVSLPTLGKAVVNTRSSSSKSSSTSKANLSTALPKLTGGVSSITSTSTSIKSSTHPTSDPVNNSTSRSGLSTGAKVGIAIGAVLIFLIALLVAFLLWRRRRNRQPSTPLDLTPEGLEVGSPPPKHELDGSVTVMPISENQLKAELADTHSMAFSEGTTQNSSPISHPATIAQVSNTASTQLQHPDNQPRAELSTIPPTPKPQAASPTQSPSPVSRRPVPAPVTSASWANAPWQAEAYPSPVEDAANAQQKPLLSGTDEQDEIRRLDEEERRIDAQIAESERIRALKEEKAAVQAKRVELMQAREKASNS